MNQKQYWNRAAQTKEFTTPFDAEEFAKYVPKDARILDVGCGYGRTLNELYNADYSDLVGVDFSDAMIVRGKKMFPYLDLRTMPTTEIPLPDASCEAVILFAVLTCIAENEAQQFLLDEVFRVLKSGGILYVNDFLLNKDERNLRRYEMFHEKYGTYGVFELPEGAVLRHHDITYVKKSLHAFEILSCRKTVYTTMNGHQSKGYCCFGKKS